MAAILAERAKLLMPFGFTERQARFLALVLQHTGVFVERQYCAFAGIAHGQKAHNFVRRLVDPCGDVRSTRRRTAAVPPSHVP